MADRTVVVQLRAAVGQFNAQMGQAAASTQAVAGHAGTAQTQVGRLGSTSAGAAGALSKLAGPAVLGGVALGLKSTVDAAVGWESAFAGVKKTVEGTPEQLQAVNDGLRDMSTEIPTSAAELAGIAESAGQLGIETDSVLDFTRVIADLGETTNLSAEQGATALARFANVTGMSQDDFDRLGSVVVDLGNNFATTESEIVDFAQRLSGAGAQVGMSESDILAIGTALSSVGINAEAGGTAFSKMMIEISNQVETGGDKLATFAEVAGMSSDEFTTAFRDDAAGALVEFVTGLGNIEAQGGNTFQVLEELGITEQRMRDALLRSSGAQDLLTDALETGNEAWEENNALTKEAEQRYDTTEAKLQIARNAFHDLATELGEGLLPMLAEGATAAADLASKLSDVGNWTPPDWLPGGQDLDLFGLMGEGFGGLIEGLPQGLPGAFGGAVSAVGQGVFGPEDPAGESHDEALQNRAAAMRDLSAATAEYQAIAAESSETRAANRAQALADAAAGAAGEFEILTTEMELNQESVDGLVTSWSDAVRELRGLADAEIGWEKALDDATAAVKEHGETVDIDTEAGRTNMLSLLDLRDAAIEHAEAVYEETGSISEANDVLDDHRDSLYEAALQAGMSKDEAREFADQLDDIPTATETFVHLLDDEASERADNWQEKLRGIPPHISTTVGVHFQYSGFVESGFEARKALRSYHSGGMVEEGSPGWMPGMASDERLSVLQTGEMVVPRSQVSQSSTTDNSQTTNNYVVHGEPGPKAMFRARSIWARS